MARLADDEECPSCGDGDSVPATGYYHCSTCGAEWHDENEEG